MLAKQIKDIKIRKEYAKNEANNVALKFIQVNYFNKNINSNKIGEFTNIKQKNYTKTKIVRRCILTNRGRGSIRSFNVSRNKLRELFQYGIVPGYKKSV
jgi:ribosomal protein S14